MGKLRQNRKGVSDEIKKTKFKKKEKMWQSARIN
jgi:hypothetical protein